MNEPSPITSHDAKPLTFGMLLFPGFTLQDLAGPQTVFAFHGQTLLLWKSIEAVHTDGGVSMNPTTTFAQCPQDLDVLFVPGGFGTMDAMRDPEILAFLAEAGLRARYVTSVCTGSLLLGMAGLLEGYRAATHWAFYESLEALGVEAVHERVAVDRNRFTGGGVTAGIDFGLTLLATMRGEEAAKVTQLIVEYDPKPPFDTGTPATAGPALTSVAMALVRDAAKDAVAVARTRRQREAA